MRIMMMIMVWMITVFIGVLKAEMKISKMPDLLGRMNLLIQLKSQFGRESWIRTTNVYRSV